MNQYNTNLSPQDLFNLIVWGGTFFFIVYHFFKSIRLVPNRYAHIVERFGRYNRTLGAGFHALIPFVERVSFVQDLKEQTIDVPPQDCFSKDEVNVVVDGVIYLSVIDPVKASYGVTYFDYAAIELAQTTTRSVIGTIDLDKTFEERDFISAKVVDVLNRAGESWGIQVHRYEIKNITPPDTVKNAMEKVVTAERERRAILAKSEGDKQSRISVSEGMKTEMINISEGEMQKRINEAEGKVEEILNVAKATAESIRKIANAVSIDGGKEAFKLQMAEKLFDNFKHLADGSTRIILPANMADIKSWMKTLDIELDK